MYTVIFKLFTSVVNPVGQPTAQSFSTRINAPYALDTYKFIPNSVPEFTFILSLFVPNFKAIRLRIKKL